MAKRPRTRGYFGDTAREGQPSRSSRPATRPDRQAQYNKTAAHKAAATVPGGLNAAEVLTLMGKIQHPVRIDDLVRFLDLSRRDKKPLEGLLDALQDEGRVIRLRGGKWVAAEQARLVTGVLSIQRSGAGFVTPDTVAVTEDGTATAPVAHGKRELQPDIFIHPGFFGDAWHGDRVEVALQPGGQHRGGRPRNPEGRILRVLERRQKELAVHVTRRSTPRGVLCRPADPRLDFVLDVQVGALPSVPKLGELLLVTPEEKIDDGLWNATARVSLGLEEDALVQERLTKLNHEIPLDFPPNVLADADELERVAASGAADLGGLKPLEDVSQAPSPDAVSKVSTAKRQDLRGVPFVTIDGEDARDFDDAVFARRVSPSGGVTWELWVAIADVSHFVLPGSRLDREARERGNSYYFPTSVEPMLPEVLSNGLCSLRPDEDRLVMAARIGFDDRGIPHTAAFFPGLIRSRGRLTYEGVHAALEGGDPDGLLSRHPYLRDAETLARTLLAQRQSRGSLDFDLPEARFIVDRATGTVTNVVRRERVFAHRLIEEFMLAANEAAARFLTEKGTPFPYRIHPAPDPDRLSTLFRTLAATDLARTDSLAHMKTAPSPAALRTILADAEGTPQAYLIGRLVLRAMMQAKYSPEGGEHFGLASPCYCHFTSPIRRYADLLVHRALGYTLGATQGPILAGHKLLMAADQCNVRERAATEAEREIGRRLGCLILQERTGETFEGVISGVTDFGFFVEFDAMPVEGMVRIATFKDDWFEYDPDRQELIGMSTGRRFRLGQAVTVRLSDVNLGRLEVNLELVGTKDTEKKASSRRSAGGRAGRGRPSGKPRNGFVPRHKRR